MSRTKLAVAMIIRVSSGNFRREELTRENVLLLGAEELQEVGPVLEFPITLGRPVARTFGIPTEGGGAQR